MAEFQCLNIRQCAIVLCRIVVIVCICRLQDDIAMPAKYDNREIFVVCYSPSL